MPITTSLLATRLIRLQVGQESTWGTPVAATSILNGIKPTPSVTAVTKATQFDEQLGSLAPSYRSSQLAQTGTFDLGGYVTYEDILYLMAGAYGLPTPTALGATQSVTAITATTAKTISANSLANPTIVTTSTVHGLTTADTVTITGSNSTPSINGVWPVIVIDTTHFSVPVNCSVAGTAGTVQTPAIVQTSGVHGLATGSQAILLGTNATTPNVDGVWTVCVHDTTHYAIPAFPTGAGTTAGTSGNPAQWTFTAPSTSAWTPATYTMEFGELGVADCAKLTSGMFQDWTITGSAGKEMEWTGKGFGKSVAFAATPTGALSYRTVEPAITPQVAFAMDPQGATPGTTAYPGILVDFTLTGNTGLKPWIPAGSLSPTTYTIGKQDLSLSISLAYTTAMQTALTSTTTLLNTGGAVVIMLTATNTGGTKFIKMPFCGTLKSDPKLWDDQDGAKLLKLELSAVVDPTLAYYTGMIVGNTLGILP